MTMCIPVVYRVTVGQLQENCYLLWKEGREDAVVVDPGAEGDKICDALLLNKKKPVAVLLTHGHFDHTGALMRFQELPIYMSPEDNFMLNDPAMNVGGCFGDTAPRPAATNPVADGDRFTLAGIEFTVMGTPGHTKGCVCYFADDQFILTGDTLFKHAYGRVDHPGGDYPALVNSLKKLLRLKKDYPIYPGHGEASTIFTEKMGL